jgi:hypothetical protein
MFGIRFLKLSRVRRATFVRTSSSAGGERVLLDPVTTIGPGRVGRFDRGHLAAADLREVDDALRLVLGLL